MKQKKTNNNLWPVNISEQNKVRYLHFGTPWVQGSMRLDKPFMIDLDYVQRMMAWLLFVEPQTLPQRQAVQLGLGTAAITKFCYKYLRMPTTAIELNPAVINACRSWFKLPLDNEKLQVLQGDAAQLIKEQRWQGAIDALQVDLYDSEAAAPVLDTVEFYQDCYNSLTEDGIMTVNLFGRDASFSASWEKIVSVFGAECCCRFYPTKDGNTIVLASKSVFDFTPSLLEARAQYIKQQWQLPAVRWLNLLLILQRQED